MKSKRIFYTELAYLFGLLLLGLGTACMERADFGVSMVVAPAYILHLKISEFLPVFSFGMAEYTLQAVILILTAIVIRKVKLSFLFSLGTAVLYGLLLDGAMTLIAFIPAGDAWTSYLYYAIGMPLCSLGVSLLFHTYISPEAYEFFVKEVSAKYKLNINKLKTVYDCSSCVIGILLSFAFFGLWQFEGIKLGTVICALLNGFLIGRFTKLLEHIWTFEDRLSLRPCFEK